MKTTINQLKNEFEQIQKIRCFEVPVINKLTNEQEYIIFDITVDDESLVATHIALTSDEENSNKIAYKSVKLDDCFSLDENLQALYDECSSAILNSDFFELSE